MLKKQFLSLTFATILLGNLCAAAQAIDEKEYFTEIDGLRHKGWVLKNRGRVSEAEMLQKRALELAETHPQAGLEYCLSDICVDIAECLQLEHRDKDALSMLDRAAQYLKQNGKSLPKRRECDINFRKGQSYVVLHNYTSAQPLLESVIQASKSDSPEHYNSLDGFHISEAEKLLGDCFAALGKNELAENHYKKAVAMSEMIVPINSQSRLPALESYHNLLIGMGAKRSADAKKIAYRIEEIKKSPDEMHGCGTALKREEEWLNWQPKIK